VINATLTRNVATASGGIHVHFKYDGTPTGIPREGIEIKSDGALVVIPPTEINGRRYTFNADCDLIVEPLEMPTGLRSLLGLGSRDTSRAMNTGSFRVNDGAIIKEGTRDNTIYNLVRGLLRGGMSADECMSYALKFGATCDPPMDEKDIQTKVRSALRGMPTSRVDLNAQVKSWIDMQHGMWDIKDLRGDLDISRAMWMDLNAVLDEMVKSNVLVRISTRSGLYRRRETELAPIDILNTDTKFIDVRLPLGLNKLVNIMPKNIIVFAGSQDSGKTAIMLNILRDNMQTHDVRYFSSEMGANEFRSRLNMFDIPADRWRFKAYERSANFADVIAPDAINIIDYLEIGDAFYQVGQQLGDIFDALDNGIAIVAIQKDSNTPLGRGGSFGMEKPRLYCTIDKDFPFTKIKIMKAKNWKHVSNNPNNLARSFMIKGGCILCPHDDWEYDATNSNSNNGRR